MMQNPDPKEVKPTIDRVVYDIIKAVCPVVNGPDYQNYIELAKTHPIKSLKCLCNTVDIRKEVIESFWFRMELEGIKDPINCSLYLTTNIT